MIFQITPETLWVCHYGEFCAEMPMFVGWCQNAKLMMGPSASQPPKSKVDLIVTSAQT
jgi:hypothetical protein